LKKNTLNKNISISIILLFLLPFFIQFAHIFEHEQHQICVNFNSEHTHNDNLDCTLFHSKITHHFYFNFSDFSFLETQNTVTQTLEHRAVYHPFSIHKSNPRAPPIVV